MFRQATLSNRYKLVHLLLILVQRHGYRHSNGSQLIELPVSRRDLASMVGTRHETISRTGAVTEQTVVLPQLDYHSTVGNDCQGNAEFGVTNGTAPRSD